MYIVCRTNIVRKICMLDIFCLVLIYDILEKHKKRDAAGYVGLAKLQLLRKVHCINTGLHNMSTSCRCKAFKDDLQF